VTSLPSCPDIADPPVLSRRGEQAPWEGRRRSVDRVNVIVVDEREDLTPQRGERGIEAERPVERDRARDDGADRTESPGVAVEVEVPE